MGARNQTLERILDALEHDGWVRVAVERNCDFWADEIWALRSELPPLGTKAWVAFLVDPEWEGARLAGQGVTAVAADLFRRKEPTGWSVQIPLGRRWERGLEELIQGLHAARKAKSAGAPAAAQEKAP